MKKRSVKTRLKIRKTRILSKLPERVQTHIPNLDKLIGSGFKKDSTNLVVGGSGRGKTVFAVQFLVGAMNEGEKCLYVTFEEKKQEFYSNMLELGWNLAEYERRGLFIFLEYTPMKVKTMLDEGGGAIESTVLSKKISRIVIDSITSFELLFQDESEKREATFALFNMISRWHCTSLLTLEEHATFEGSASSSRAVEFESDAIIMLYYARTKKGRERYLEILKMRGTPHSRRIYKFDITKRGIVVDKKPTTRLPRTLQG